MTDKCASVCNTARPSVGDSQAPNDGKSDDPTGSASTHDSGATSATGNGNDGGRTPTSKNKTTCSQLGDYACSCQIPTAKAPANDFDCDPKIGLAAVCCADEKWPSSGSCSCLTAACDRPGGGGCDCSLGTAGDTCVDGAVCCAGPYGDCKCTYGIDQCWMGYRKVNQCDATAIGCRDGKKTVASCSLAK
jgi:hypothetical protein